MVYLVDFENVSNNGIVGIESLSAEDAIIIFYSKNANSISLSNHMKLENSDVKKEYIEVSTNTRNALDFQLATYIGSLIEKNIQEDYAIVSKDEGFNAVVDFWKKRGVVIEKYTDLNNTNVTNLTEEVEKLLPEHKDKINNVVNIIMKYKTKQGINNTLVKAYKSETAGMIYKAIKPLIKDKKGRDSSRD